MAQNDQSPEDLRDWMRAWLPARILWAGPSITTYYILILGPILRGLRTVALPALPLKPALPSQCIANNIILSLELDSNMSLCILMVCLDPNFFQHYSNFERLTIN